MTNLTELKKLAEAATPGPWWCGDHIKENIYAGSNTAPARISRTNNLLNSRFITAANPQTILQMIAVMEQMRDALGITYVSRDSDAAVAEALAAYKELMG
jgi:hypothetical protein